MSSPQKQQILQAQATTSRLAQEGYDIALPGISSEYKDLNAALGSGGEPGFVADAYKEARGGILEGAATSQQAAQADRVRGGQRARSGGSFTASINPNDAGSKLAQALYGTRISEAQGKLEENNKLMGMALGQSSQTGSGALQATGQELQSIGYMQPYNSTYANVLGALNTAGSLYGAAKGSGAFSGGGSSGMGGDMSGFGVS